MQKMILQGTGNVQSQCIFWIKVFAFGQELPQSPQRKASLHRVRGKLAI